MKHIETIMRWIVIGGIFLLPFVPMFVASGMFFPYITGKNFAFRVLVELMAGAWIVLALVETRYIPRRSWIFGMFALFIAIMAVANAHGAYPAKSFWSNFERMDGWITIAHTFVYMIVIGSFIQSEQLWRRLFQTSLGVSVALSMYGLLQVLGVIALGQGGGTGLAARIDSTFGNPIYLAVYMLFHVFIAALLWAQDSIARKTNVLRIALYVSIMILDSATLALSETRGSILGLVIGAGVVAGTVLLSGKQSQGMRRGATILVGCILAFSAAIYTGRDSALVQNVGFLHRLTTFSIHDQTIQARLLNIQTAWHGFEERPLLGWGQENYALVFDKYYDPRMYADEPWFDRVHNIIFDWLIAGGILGLGSYLAIFVATFYLLWRKQTNVANPLHILERGILSGLLVGYFVHNVTVFDNVTSYIMWATILGYIVWRTHRSTETHIARAPFKREDIPVVAIVGGILTVTCLWWVNWIPYTQNITLLNALINRSSTVTDIQHNFDAAIAYNRFGTQEAREQMSEFASAVAGSPDVPAAQKQAFYDDISQQLKQQSHESPLDARFPLFLSSVSLAFGNTAAAVTSLQHAQELSPRKQSIIMQQAGLAQSLGQASTSLALFKNAYELEPRNTQARVTYANALLAADRTSDAVTLLQPIATTTAIVSADIAGMFTRAHAQDELTALWKTYLDAHTTDPQAYMTVAAAYYRAGDKESSIATLKQLARLVPAAASQIDTIIEQVRTNHLAQ